MGALDDAIREHLELKRQRGASDEELNQKEKEAFGPAPSGAWQTSGPEAPSADFAPPPPAAEDEAAAEDESGFAVAEDTYDSAGPPEREPEELEAEIRAAEAMPALAAEPNGLDPDQLEPDEVLPEDSLEPDAIAPGAEVEEWRSDEPPPNGSPAPVEPADDSLEVSDDVLEETPDFLEDAPEQDQLWFEQKPPKDFDFGD
jgi:hypothetical protein